MCAWAGERGSLAMLAPPPRVSGAAGAGAKLVPWVAAAPCRAGGTAGAPPPACKAVTTLPACPTAERVRDMRPKRCLAD